MSRTKYGPEEIAARIRCHPDRVQHLPSLHAEGLCKRCNAADEIERLRDQVSAVWGWIKLQPSMPLGEYGPPERMVKWPESSIMRAACAGEVSEALDE